MKMKKTLLTQLLFLFIFCFSFINSIAQDTITNQGLNRWEKSGKQPPFDWSEPQGWTSSNSLTEFISAGVRETTIPQSGSSQAQLRTLNIFGENVPAVLINGNFPISISDTSKFPLLGGEPISSVKTKFYGMYNFETTTAGDSATIVVAFKKFNTNTQKPDLVAIGEINLPPTQSGLYPFSFTINPVTFDTPDSVVVTILSSKVDDFKAGGVLEVDYIGFDKPSILPPSSIPLKNEVYPSPATSTLTIKAETVGSDYIIYDIAGKVQTSGTLNSRFTNLDISSLANGVYLISFDNGLETLRFLKAH